VGTLIFVTSHGRGAGYFHGVLEGRVCQERLIGWERRYAAGMIQTMAVSGYRSLRELVLPLGRLNLVTGANGSGKSSLYRALRLLGEAAQGGVVASLAREGGLASTLWAGPETVSRAVRRGEFKVEPTARQKPVSLKLGFSGETYGYGIDLGYPPPGTIFALDPAIKREAIWHGGLYRRSSALVERKNNFVYLPTEGDEEPVMLTQQLGSADSMLASIADPVRAPEMLAVRESIRRWRFYDGFRTDMASPVRTPQIGTFTPVLNNEGTDVASAIATIRAIGTERLWSGRWRMRFRGAGCMRRSRRGGLSCSCSSMGCYGRWGQRSYPMGRCGFCFGQQHC